ncbi:MAG: ATP-binding cassette domain-containing protein [Gammaproteobacteria bacterium]|nr:ATP-binding cassette domain-containing protein [Gammaproteobacteria bacterium]
MTGNRQLDVADLRVDGLGPIDLYLDEGECLVLSGPSGAGKSRLLRAIADLDAHEGRVACQGTAAEDLSPSQWRRRVGMLAADSQWWRDRVAEHFDTPPTSVRLETLDLAPALLEGPVSRLSSGERQRFALLRLLANRPRVLLLDEPTANLDPDNVIRVEKLVADYTATGGAAVLWVSHDPLQTARVAHRQLYLEAGKLSRKPAPHPMQDRPS